MNCQNCGAPMKPIPDRDYFHCEYCWSFFFPQESRDGVRVLGEESHIDCPLCKTPLVSASTAGMRILYCLNCQGLLITQPLFPNLVRELRSRARGEPDTPRPLDTTQLKRRVHCPSCRQRMSTHPYAGPGNIVIDLCAHCGLIWLDHGELGKVMHAPGRDRGQRIDKSRSDEWLHQQIKVQYPGKFKIKLF